MELAIDVTVVDAVVVVGNVVVVLVVVNVVVVGVVVLEVVVVDAVVVDAAVVDVVVVNFGFGVVFKIFNDVFNIDGCMIMLGFEAFLIFGSMVVVVVVVVVEGVVSGAVGVALLQVETSKFENALRNHSGKVDEAFSSSRKRSVLASR